MTAAAILPRLRAAGAEAALRGGKVVVSRASVVPPALLAEAKARRADLLEELANDNAAQDNLPFVEDLIERAAIQAEAMPVQRRRKRMVSWAQPEDIPQPGDFCGYCAGQLWWTATPSPGGWCCCRCDPPCHLQPGEFQVVAT